MLSFSRFLFGEGFIAETLVKMPGGYTAIDKLAKDDLIICYDFKSSCDIKPIVAISQKLVKSHLKIATDNKAIYVAPKHRFYLPLEKRWVRAQKLEEGQVLLAASNNYVRINDITEIQKEAIVFTLSVKDYHNFCVSKQDIVVHNFAIFVPIITVTTAGEILFTSLVNLCAAGGFILLNKLLKSAGIRARGSFYNPQEPDDKDRRNKPYGIYEDAPYHGRKDNGLKSKGPINGQGALDNSVQIRDTSNCRGGISDGEFVVLSRTAEGMYHGHVRTWQDLTQRIWLPTKERS